MSKRTIRKQEEAFDFEKALAELEHLVETMEQGDLTLEQSLKDFERGVELTRACRNALQEAEQKVQILVEKSEKEALVPFDIEQDDADA